MPIESWIRWAAACAAVTFASAVEAQFHVPSVDIELSGPLAPLAGQLSTPAPGQSDIGFWGTDMGFYFAHEGALFFLFGDTVQDSQSGAHIAPGPGEPLADDALGLICLRHGPLCPDSLPVFPTGQEVESYITAHPAPAGAPDWWAGGPPVNFATRPEPPKTTITPITVINHGVAPRAMIAPIPGPGFSNHMQGAEAGAFAVFNGPIARCVWGCPTGFECNTQGGVYQSPFDTAYGPDDGGYFPCQLPSQDPLCHDVGGVCYDPKSPLAEQPNPNALDQTARRFELGNAEIELDAGPPHRFIAQSWVTHKMTNPAMSTVQDFDPSRSVLGDDSNDYSPPHGPSTKQQKVFMWGRPGFATDGKAWTYFAYADMPRYSATADFSWHPRYYTGLSPSGVPQFSEIEADAAPLIMNIVGEPSPDEPWSLVNMISVRWIAPLQKWVMLYGGGTTQASVPEGSVMEPANSMFVRFAEHPFGPWSEPQILFRAGDPTQSASELADTEYGPGGILYHTTCTAPDCAPGEAFWHEGLPPFAGRPYGFLYGPNLIQEWTSTRHEPEPGVDIYWTVSTFAPYQVVLMRTRINDPSVAECR